LVWCFQSYSQASKENGHAHEFIEERAPSTAEEFKKMAEEKLRQAQQGVASQTAEKVYHAAEEATLGDSDLQSVKHRYEEHEHGGDYRRRSGDESDGVKACSNKAKWAKAALYVYIIRNGIYLPRFYPTTILESWQQSQLI
jgi:hypothetical protein